MTRPRRGKHIPQRTCIICRRTLAKRELNRIVRSPQGVVFDPTGKLAGRGAYLCNSTQCWNTALTRGGLARALKTTLTPEEHAALQEIAKQRARAEMTPAPES